LRAKSPSPLDHRPSQKYEAYCAMTPGIATCAGIGFSALPFLGHIAQIVVG
jgi:hypothetical protein